MSKTKHTASFEIEQPAIEIFPLFSAEGEKLWVPGWDYKNISGGIILHEDFIFLTQNHDHASTEAIWLVKKYDEENFNVQFYKVEPQDKIGIIDVKCFQLNDTHTKVQVSYEYIGLSGKGNEFISNFTQTKFEDFISEWKVLLEEYSKTKH